MRILFAALLLLAALLPPAAAEERITRFSSEIEIRPDGGLVVTETIAATVEGQRIRRGIYRDFPTRYRDARGRLVLVGFEVLAVERDGRPERWRLEARGAGVRVWIGDPDVLLEPGRHVWTLRYRTDRQLGFFDRHDELYWNVTGNEWAFAIERAEVLVRLPEAAPILDHAGYTGPRGAKGGDFEVLEAAAGRFRARTTRVLGPGEGFTVAVAFPKGIVAAPAGTVRATGPLWAPVAAVVAVLVFYLLVWWRVGRDPPPGTIVPLFEPPSGMGPAAARYVWRAGSDRRGFVGALLDLGVKRRLRVIEDADGAFRLERTDPPPGAGQPTPGERALFETLFAGAPVVAVDRGSGPRLRAARAALEAVIETEYEGAVFRRNRGWFALGVVVSLLAVAGAIFLVRPGVEVVAAGILTGLGFASLLLRLRHLARRWREASTRLAGLGRLLPELVALVAFTVVPLGFLVLVFADTGQGVPFALWTPAEIATVGAVPVIVLLQAVFWRLLHAPTRAGRRLLDELAGFRRYLEVAEEHRLGILHPPELTPELFERYLPWAYALDCEHAWSARFNEVLREAAVTPASGWYVGRGIRDPVTLSRHLSRSFAAGVATASAPPPGSGSGLGGGGSSGGGGGGGGGGGW